jgi:hypothetical protein
LWVDGFLVNLIMVVSFSELLCGADTNQWSSKIYSGDRRINRFIMFDARAWNHYILLQARRTFQAARLTGTDSTPCHQ